jgi:hypothetical protein
MHPHMAIDKRPLREIPRTITEFVRQWTERHPERVEEGCRSSRRCRQALKLVLEPRGWFLAERPPEMVYSNRAGKAA